VRLHRVVVRMRPAAPAPGERERVDHRPAPGIAMEVVEPAQNAFAVCRCRRRVGTPGRGLPSHPVRYPGTGAERAHCRPRQASGAAPVIRPTRAAGLDRDLDPAAEVAGLGPGRLIPRHPDCPQEPEPPQQRDRIRPQSVLRPAGHLQIPQIHGGRRDHGASLVMQPARLPRIAGPLHRTRPRNDQGAEVPRLVLSDHEPRKYRPTQRPAPRTGKTLRLVQITGKCDHGA